MRKRNQRQGRTLYVSKRPKSLTHTQRAFALADEKNNQHNFNAQVVRQGDINARYQCVIKDVDTVSIIVSSEVDLILIRTLQ